MDFDEMQYEKKARAGFIPYIFDEVEGCWKYLMMISSDPKLGGPRPMISKGKIESNENAFQCALREAEEELGLKLQNIKGEAFYLFEEQTVLRSGTYHITVYAGEIKDRYDFNNWCDETLYIEWHSKDSFMQNGRRDHLKYVLMLEEKLTAKGE